MHDIDDYDKQILKLLRQNGRLTNQELGELVGLSASQISRRRIHLEQQKYIIGYSARISPASLAKSIVRPRKGACFATCVCLWRCVACWELRLGHGPS